MVQQAHIPIQRGETWAPPGYESSEVTSGLYGQSTDWEGREAEFENVNPSTGLPYNNQTTLLRLVRNASGGTLAAGDALVYTSGYRLNRGRVTKATQAPDATHVGDFDGVVDSHYTGTIPVGHLFWMGVNGLNKAKIAEANAVAIGNRLVVNASGTVGLAAIGTGDAAGTNQALSGQRCIAEAIKAATGGAATTVATLVSLDCDPHVVD